MHHKKFGFNHVCLITPGHISTNPRLVKEASILVESGYQVHIIFTQYVKELIVYDEAILAKFPSLTTSILNWSGSSLKSKWNRLHATLNSKLSKNESVLVNRNFKWQLREAINIKAQVYIAHNLGALPVAVLAAEKNKVKSGFDAEDFHRYEASDDNTNPTVILKKSIEDRFIPNLTYLTTASYLISEKYQSIYKKEAHTILNVFPKTKVFPSISDSAELKLFWFSQTIGEERGIELIFEALSLCTTQPELHLLGNISDQYLSKLKNLATEFKISNQLFIHSTIPPDQVMQLSATFDIGLASENTTPLNRNICLTNKLFTYIQSGLAVLASPTEAQKLFMSNYPELGKIYHDAADLSSKIMFYDTNRSLLNHTKLACYECGQSSLNWETESEKFLSRIEETITSIV